MADVEVYTFGPVANYIIGMGGPYYLDLSIAAIVHGDSGDDVNISRTIDKGATWNTTQLVLAVIRGNIACWFDQQTPGILGNKVHIAWLDGSTFRYINYDIDTQTIGTERVLATGLTTTTKSGGNISFITKTKDGNLLCGYRSLGSQLGTFISSDEFATAGTVIANPTEGPADYVLAFPAATGADADACVLYWDGSANILTTKIYERAGDAWTETSILTGVFDVTVYPYNFGGTVRHSDGMIFGAIHTQQDNAADILKTFTVLPNSIISPVIDVTTAPVFSAQAESSQLAIHIAQGTGHIRIAYSKGGTFPGLVDVVYHVSIDDMVSWGGEQAYSEGARDDFKPLAAGGTTPTTGGQYQPVWNNDDFTSLWVSVVNAEEIAAGGGNGNGNGVAGSFKIGAADAMANQPSEIRLIPAGHTFHRLSGGGSIASLRGDGARVVCRWGLGAAKAGAYDELITDLGGTPGTLGSISRAHTITWNDPGGTGFSVDTVCEDVQVVYGLGGYYRPFTVTFWER